LFGYIILYVTGHSAGDFGEAKTPERGNNSPEIKNKRDEGAEKTTH
jgi:hypothetical protein